MTFHHVNILSIQVGKPASVNSPPLNDQSGERIWTTGFLKKPIDGPVHMRRLNFDGDGQADGKHHGGPDKAVCVYSHDHYAFWKNEYNVDFPLGAFGENLTLTGLTESDVCVGDVWEMGTAKTEVSQPRQPCWKLSRWWNINDLAVRVQQTGKTGWYLRVLAEGTVEAGTPIRLIDRPHPDWSIAAANTLMHVKKDDLLSAGRLLRIPALSESWRQTLLRRTHKQAQPSFEQRLFGTATPTDTTGL